MKQRFASFALLAVVAASTACTCVAPGYVGIKVSMAGDSKGVDSVPAVTGWTFYNPLLTSVYEYPTFVQTATWTRSLDEGKPANEEVTFTNADQMAIALDVNLSYHLVADKVPAFYVKFRSDDLNRFTHGFLRNTARDIFNEHGGKYRIDQIMGDNADFLKEVRASLQTQVKDIGVEIDTFGIIGSPRPPPVVFEAINAKVHAVQVAQQKQNELVQAQADAAKIVATAEGDAKSILVRAKAQADANRLLAESLSDRLVQNKMLDKWDGKLPQINGGSTNPFVSVGSK